MILKSELLSIFSEEELNFYIIMEDITIDENDIVIFNSQSALLEIATRTCTLNTSLASKLLLCVTDKFNHMYIEFLINLFTNNVYELNYCIKDLPSDYNFIIDFYKNVVLEKKKDANGVLFHEFNETYNTNLKLFLHQKHYKLASSYANYIYEKTNNYSYLILSVICDKYMDNINYISSYDNEIDQALERKLYIEILNNPFSKEVVSTVNLIIHCNGGDSSFYDTLKLMIAICRDMKQNHNIVAMHSSNAAFGESYNLIYNLLRRRDFYRVNEILQNYESFSFDMGIEILKEVNKTLMKLNKINNTYLKECMELENDGNYAKYHTTKLTADLIRKMSINDNNKVNNNSNYYVEYLEHRGKKEYKKAYESLIRFEKTMDGLGIKTTISHLKKELQILIHNSNEADEETQGKMNELISKANLEEIKGEYRLAISYYNSALNYMSIANPMIFVKIAKCYVMMDYKKEAINFLYYARKEFLYPDDYILLIELLFFEERYSEIEAIVNDYEQILPDENDYIHYLLSIAYIEQGEYVKAINELNKCIEINKNLYNIELDYDYEKGIIKNICENKETTMYSLEDYIDYSLTEEEEKIKKEIFRNNSSLEDILNNYINPGLVDSSSIIKVLLFLERDDDVVKLKRIIKASKNETLLKSLKNYRFL